jgi:hypothetical protein
MKADPGTGRTKVTLEWPGMGLYTCSLPEWRAWTLKSSSARVGRFQEVHGDEPEKIRAFQCLSYEAQAVVLGEWEGGEPVREPASIWWART